MPIFLGRRMAEKYNAGDSKWFNILIQMLFLLATLVVMTFGILIIFF
jgi:hypothetical protein